MSLLQLVIENLKKLVVSNASRTIRCIILSMYSICVCQEAETNIYRHQRCYHQGVKDVQRKQEIISTAQQDLASICVATDGISQRYQCLMQ
jgi:hypothetical protein